MSIKEMWGKLKYWQRGGVIAAIVGSFFYYVQFWGLLNLTPIEMGATGVLIYSLLFSPIDFLTIFVLHSSENVYESYMVTVSFYLLIGASIAHVIYESKNSVTSSGKSKWYTKIIAFLIVLFYFSISFLYFILGIAY